MTQGRNANRNGREAENIIAGVLERRGIPFTRQYRIGNGIFDTPVAADFYAPSVKPFPNGLIIESKWQQVAGTAEEKLCYLVENIHYCYPCTTVIVIDGDGFRVGALRWLRSQAGHGRLFAVLSLVEFVTWSNSNL